MRKFGFAMIGVLVSAAACAAGEPVTITTTFPTGVAPAGAEPVPISWCDNGRGGKWGEQGFECHAADPAKRKPIACGYRMKDGSIPDQKAGSSAVCQVPAGFEDVSIGDESLRQH